MKKGLLPALVLASLVFPVTMAAGDGARYAVFAWNDLGMHCMSPTYDTVVLLPPFNTLQVQVVMRGEQPRLLDPSSGIGVSFRIVDNTSSADKRGYGQFWAQLTKLFDVTRPTDVGLGGLFGFTDQGLTGTMDWDGKAHTFRAEGIPVVPVDDIGTWNPYQQAVVTVTVGGAAVAETRAMLPVSDEIACGRCHAPGRPLQETFEDIISKHDRNRRSSLASRRPVLCASCHGSPALGGTKPGLSGTWLSEAVHTRHARLADAPTCYDCHPGRITKCSRSAAHTAADGNCLSCHGTLGGVGRSISQGRTPWLTEPSCGDCHKAAETPTLSRTAAAPVSTIAGVDTGTVLYRNSLGHGGLACSACHGSPHAMVPSREVNDNFQALAYQGRAVSIGSCSTCHPTSRGGGPPGTFMKIHGGASPEKRSACAVCHTSIPSGDTARWPHKFQWRSR
jgi:hypothetical protein